MSVDFMNIDDQIVDTSPMEDVDRSEYLDKNDPRSMYNISFAPLKKALDSLPENMFEKSEKEIIDELKPDGTMNLLRYRFWDEYSRVQGLKSNLNAAQLCAGVCTLPYLYKRVLKNKLMTAFLICPPSSYLDLAEEALGTGMIRLREILQFPLYNKKGEPNTATAKLMLSAIQMLERRMHGAPMQKHEIKSLNMHASSKAVDKQIERMVEDANMDAIEKALEPSRNEQEKEELALESEHKMEEFKSRGIDVSRDELDVTPKKLKKDF